MGSRDTDEPHIVYTGFYVYKYFGLIMAGIGRN